MKDGYYQGGSDETVSDVSKNSLTAQRQRTPPVAWALPIAKVSVEHLTGNLQADSTPGEGTEVVVNFR